MIHEEICTYEVCKLAKEKGFDVQTFGWYDYTGNYHKGFIPHELHECPRYKEYYAPTQSLLQRSLREEKGVVVIPYFQSVLKRWSATYELLPPRHSKYAFIDLRKDFRTYELALEDALKYALENLA